MRLALSTTVVALIGAVTLTPVVASAGTTTVGQFSQLNGVRTFRYRNLDVVTKLGKKPHQTTVITPAAELISINKKGLQATPIINFQANVNGIGVSVGQTIKAYFSLDATSTQAVQDVGGSLSQLFDGFVSFTDVATGKLLLRSDFMGASLTAVDGSFSFNANGNTSTGTVVYTSDVFKNLGVVNDFSLSGSGTDRKITYTAGHSFDYKSGFKGSVTGTFSSVVPEPAVLGMFGLGLLGLGLARRRAA